MVNVPLAEDVAAEVAETGNLVDSEFRIRFNYGPDVTNSANFEDVRNVLEAAADELASHIADPVTLFVNFDFGAGGDVLGTAAPETLLIP